MLLSEMQSLHSCKYRIYYGDIAVIAKPIIEDKKDYIKNGAFLIFLLILTMFIAFTEGENRPVDRGGTMCLLVLYLANNVYSAKGYAPGIDNTPSDGQRCVRYTKKDAPDILLNSLLESPLLYWVPIYRWITDYKSQRFLSAFHFDRCDVYRFGHITARTGDNDHLHTEKSVQPGSGNIIGAIILNIIQGGFSFFSDYAHSAGA